MEIACGSSFYADISSLRCVYPALSQPTVPVKGRVAPAVI